MRKSVLILTFLVFTICFAAGIYAASLLPEGTRESLKVDQRTIKTPASQFQQNILIIHVDDLQAESPALISVWGMILYFPQPTLIFQPLFPLAIEGNEDLLDFYAISPGKVPSEKFLSALSIKNDIFWDNYILLDSSAVQVFLTQTSENELALADISDTSGVIQREEALISGICLSFTQQENSFVDNFTWQNLMNTHMQTDIPMDTFLVNQQKLLGPEKPAQCDVFGE